MVAYCERVARAEPGLPWEVGKHEELLQQDQEAAIKANIVTHPVAMALIKLVIADKKFEPAGFAAPLGFKDNRLVLAAAEKLQVPLPIASLIYNRFLTLLARGGEKLDWSAFSQLAAEDAGMHGL